jgi:CHASE2 domain-containing sensor protein
MERLVTIKIVNSNSDAHLDRIDSHQRSYQGSYHVTLQIAQEYLSPNDRILLYPQVEMTGELPSATALLEDFQNWQQSYLDLDLGSRLEANIGQITNISTINLVLKCQMAAQKSLDSFDRWLNAESFHQIREQLAHSVNADDRVRFFLQIEDPQLHCLPWQVGNIFTRYNSTEVVLSSSQFTRIEQSNSTTDGVRILAILGNSTGINIAADRQILENLPNAKVEFLVEPKRKEINDRLWEQPWDILFFAGHSSSSQERTTGQIYINQTDKLNLEELRYGLTKAIANGLKIAIFNSCDGLGLAKALSDLKIPQIIVMREPVPDRVAQDFLTEFLTLYARGSSFYKSVRAAREKLQGLEDKFPCATWLPTVYQQGTNYPPTWKQLQGTIEVKKQQVKVAILTSLCTSIAIAALRFWGILQPLELFAFDLTMRSRPAEVQDSHLLVIQVTREDVDRQQQEKQQQNSSLSNQSLNDLLKYLGKYHPRIIGVDTYLDREISTKYQFIKDNLTSGKLVPVCKINDRLFGEKETQPPVGAELFGFGDTLADPHGIMRRHLLSMDAQPGACRTAYALSTMLAYAYLQDRPQPIELKIHPHSLQIGSKQFQFLNAHRGGYQQFDDRGYQMLLNYRASGSLTDAIPAISLQKILTLPDRELQQSIENKIILIGTTDSRYKDISKTPYAAQSDNQCREHEGYQCIPGVFLQAQMISQLVNAGLENRPLFWAYSFEVDSLIILCCALMGSLLGLMVGDRHWLLLGLSSGIIILFLYGSSVALLAISGYWFPLVPAWLGLVITGSCVKIYLSQATKFSEIDSN